MAGLAQAGSRAGQVCCKVAQGVRSCVRPHQCASLLPHHLVPLQSSGGVSGGANPPAYDRARRKEEAELLALPEPGEQLVGGGQRVSRVRVQRSVGS